jgi:hypothetical protein
VQEKAAARAKETQESLQTKVNELIGGIDTDLKKIGETAQDLALRSVGLAAEYAVKAREAYEKVAEHGEQAVRTWRGGAADEIEEFAVAVEPEPAPSTPKPEAVRPRVVKPAPAVPATKASAPVATATTGTTTSASVGTPAGTSAKKAAVKKAPVRKSTAKKTTPPAK